MAMFLTLATVRDTSRAERDMKEKKWRNDYVPAKDPTGLTLGIVGLGAIGKVKSFSHSFPLSNFSAFFVVWKAKLAPYIVLRRMKQYFGLRLIGADEVI